MVALRTYVTLGMLVITGSLLAYAWHQRDERLRAEGRYELEHAKADSLLAVNESVRAHEDSTIAVQTVKVDTLIKRVVVAQTRTDTIIEQVVAEAGADSAVARRAATVVRDSIYLYVVGPLWQTHAADSTIIASQGRKLVAAEAALAAQVALVQPRPGFVEKHGGTAVKMLGSFAAGYGWATSRK